MNLWATIGTSILAFLLGAVPFSWLIGRLHQGVDIRSTGSGNIGATNLARAIGLGPGMVALLLDAGKGVAAVLFAQWVAGSAEHASALPAIAGGLAVIGHNFSPFLRFRGGKGVATGAGVFGTLSPWALVAALVVFIVVVLLSRLVSLGSVLAACSLPVAVFLIYDSPSVGLLSMAIAALVVVRHWGNLLRIVRGTEDRVTDRGENAEGA
jgi:glycerol-3-phosphate acyltransferase PlsY